MKYIRLILLVCMVSMLCCGCGAGGTSGEDEAAATFMEHQKAQLDIGRICGFGKAGGEYICIGETENGSYVKAAGSDLNGEFRQEKMNTDDLLSGDDMISAVYIDDDKSLYLAVSSVREDDSIVSRIVKAGSDGRTDVLTDGIEGNVDSIRLTADGDSYVAGCSGGVIQSCTMDGKIKYTIDDVDYTDICIAGDKLVVLAERNITIYSVADGSTLESISSFDDAMAEGMEGAFSEKGKDALSCSNIMKYNEDTDQIFMMLSTGLFEYRLSDKLGIRLATLKGGDKVYELLVDDKDTFVAVMGSQESGKNIVVYSAADMYEDQADGHNVQEKSTVTLYSLYYSEAYENMISWYEDSHSDMTVEYVWGIDDTNGISESEAINSLNTQLLAKEGPDVIIMDGLNVKSYENTGVLMELSQVVDEIRNNNPDCLEKVMDTYRNEDNSIYAVPAYESFTALVGPENEIKGVDNIQSLVAYMNSLDTPTSGNDMSFYYWECYFDTLYPLYASDIVDIYGDYDRDKLKVFLEDLKVLYDSGMDRTTQEQIDEWTNAAGTYDEQKKKAVNTTYMRDLFNREWSGRRFALVNMATTVELQYFYSVKEDSMAGNEANTVNEDYEYELWGNDDGAVYVPNTIFAINNKDENRDAAIRFVEDMFSTDMQKLYYGVECGNPVNMYGVRAANEMALEMGTPGGIVNVGGNDYMNWSYWRTDGYLEDYISKLRQLKSPSNPDARIRSMIRAEIADYLEGGVSIDDTVSAIDSQLGVYLSE
jgi:ABC-type glycerol-3-phosphate transport system substrate-binding protein